MCAIQFGAKGDWATTRVQPGLCDGADADASAKQTEGGKAPRLEERELMRVNQDHKRDDSKAHQADTRKGPVFQFTNGPSYLVPLLPILLCGIRMAVA